MRQLRNVVVVLGLMILAASAARAQATVSIKGKLVDRDCSVIDVFQLQPASEYRCTLWLESSWSCPLPSGEPRTCKSTFTFYCPNAAVDNRPMNSAFWSCSDPSGMQIRHPSRWYTFEAFPRTVAQQADGNGQFLLYSIADSPN